MKKIIILVILSLLGLTFQRCATTPENASSQGAGLGAAVGAAAGALLDKKNPWRGAVIGGAAGAILGGGIVEISRRASINAAARNQTVVYRKGATVVEATPVSEPYYNYQQKTTCKKVRKRIWENGKLVTDHIEEVCQSTKTTPSY